MDARTSQAPQTFADHVHELRRRLFWPTLLLFIGATIAFIVRDRLVKFLVKPLNQTLYYNNPAGSFNFVMKLSMIMGITIAIPALIYSLVTFIEPAVSKRITKRLITVVSVLSLVLGLAGAAFAYYAALPMSLRFFQGMKLTGIDPLISADAYLNFALTCILTFILLFQLPMLVLFANHVRPISPRKLLKQEKYVIIGSLVIALILPFSYDPLTQFVIAVPIIVLYNLSIVFVYIANHRQRKRKRSRAHARRHAAVAKPTAKAEPAPQVVPAQRVTAPAVVRRPAPRMEPVVPRSVAAPVRRPILDVQQRGVRSGNFLDLRPSK